MYMDKGQVYSVEMAITFIMFLSFVAYIDNVWTENIVNAAVAGSYFEEKKMQLSSLDLLVSTPGEPYNWDENNVSSVGLVWERGILDYEKVEMIISLTSSNYTKAMEALGLEKDFYLFISSMDGKSSKNNK